MSKWASWQSPNEYKELDESGRSLSLQTDFFASYGMAAKYRDEAHWRELGAAVRSGKVPGELVLRALTWR